MANGTDIPLFSSKNINFIVMLQCRWWFHYTALMRMNTAKFSDQQEK